MTSTRNHRNSTKAGTRRELAMAAAVSTWLLVAPLAISQDRATMTESLDVLSREEMIRLKVEESSVHASGHSESAGRCISLAEMSILFDAAADDDAVTATLNAVPDQQFASFLPQGSRWTYTATDGTVSQGERITITYSFIPDGTSIQVSGNPTPEPSSLFANLDANFPGGRAAWKARFAEALNRWSELVNITYVEVPDDGLPFPTTIGQLAAAGVTGRGDVRIGMRSLGAPLAVNFYPQFGGDMVLDSQDVATLVNASNNFRSLRNVLMHEHGHGMGLQHVLPTNDTKLMEPFLSAAYDGPQEDDIRGAQFIYGDSFEQNNVIEENTFVGGPLRDPVQNGVQTFNIDDVSIERSGQTDFYGFTAFAGAPIAIRVDPIGTDYQFAPENNPGSLTTVNAKAVRNLGLRLWRRTSAANNTFVMVAQINFNQAGNAEYHPPVPYSAAGYMVAEVFSDDDINDVQRYRVTISNSAIQPPVEPANIRVFDGADELTDDDTVRFDSTEVGNVATKTINIVNDGTGPLEIGTVSVAGPAAGDYNFTLLQHSLQPGQSTSLALAFVPAAAGQRVAVISIPNNDPDRAGFSFIVSGTATVQQAPAIQVEVDNAAVNPNDGFDFGDIEVGDSRTVDCRIRNTGNATLSVIAINLSGDAAADYASTLSSATLAPGGSVLFNVTVTPSATGPRDATLTIAGNAQPTSFRVNFFANGVETVQIDDCNSNGVADSVDIASATSGDCNGNGIPDECETDSDGDGVIDDCDRCAGLDDALDTDADGTPDCVQNDPDENNNQNNNDNNNGNEDNLNQNGGGNQNVNANNNANNNENDNGNGNANDFDDADNGGICGSGSVMPMMMSLASLCGAGGLTRRRMRQRARSRGNK